MQDRRVTVRELAVELGISTSSVHFILIDHLTMWKRGNAPAHSLQLIQIFLAKYNIPGVRQAPYFSDMYPYEFWLFTRLKTQLKGTQFEPRNDIIRNTAAKLYSLCKKAFQKA
jgi:hypothetical protein